MDDIGIWSRALSDAEIRRLYAAGSTCIPLDSVVLYVDPKPGRTYQWSTGHVGESLTVDPATLPYVWVTDGICSDTIRFTKPGELPPDTVIVMDTLTILDTNMVLTSVTDTLLIGIPLEGGPLPDTATNIRLYADQGGTRLYLESDDPEGIVNHSFQINNAEGVPMAASIFNQAMHEVDISQWIYPGLYQLLIFDPMGVIISRKAIWLK